MAHWLQGFPLLRMKPEETGNKKPQGIAMLDVWVLFVRQAAALCRIDAQYWESMTRPYVERFEQVYHQQLNITTDSDSRKKGLQLVEDTVRMITIAADVRANYKGDWPDSHGIYAGELYVFSKDGIPNATDVEYRLVAIVMEYREKVNQAIRKRLGDCYGEWESYLGTLPDDGTI
jgi:hypothetical protein